MGGPCSSRRIFLAAVLLTGMSAFADLKDIRKDKLPNDPAVQSAYDDVATIESMVRVWRQTWGYPTPKDEVVARVSSSLIRLQNAAKAVPENEELLLLIGLVAHYSFNLDVEENYKVAVASFEESSKLMPDDFRPPWFLGNHLCQAAKNTKGMEKFLYVEQQTPGDRLPASFWDDYLSCAHLANMPAHALWAADRANKLDPQGSSHRQFLIEASRNRFKASDAATSYDAKDVWRSNHLGSSIRFTCPLFGMQFLIPGDWRIRIANIGDGASRVIVQTGPYAGRSGQVIPNVMIMARPPKPGETLADFLKAAIPGQPLKAATAPACPAQQCLAAEDIKPNGYQAEGDGHATIVVFKRDEPDYPGLIFEAPVDFPKTEGSGMHYFHADERLRRLPGTLYYLVMLDTADSVLTQAQDAYLSFLKGMRIE